LSCCSLYLYVLKKKHKGCIPSGLKIKIHRNISVASINDKPTQKIKHMSKVKSVEYGLEKYLRSTRFPSLLGTDYVEFYVGNAKQSLIIIKLLLSIIGVCRSRNRSKGQNVLCVEAK
jgi:hypothetical protein